MNQTIYELNQEQQHLNDDLFWMVENESDEELKRKIESRLGQINGTISNKLKFLSTILAEQKSIVEDRKEVIKKAQQRSKVAENVYNRLREFTLTSMINSNIKKVEGDYCTISVRKGVDSLHFNPDFDIELIEDRFKKVITKTDPIKSEIKTALQDGEYVQGAFLRKTPSLTVK